MHEMSLTEARARIYKKKIFVTLLSFKKKHFLSNRTRPFEGNFTLS